MGIDRITRGTKGSLRRSKIVRNLIRGLLTSEAAREAVLSIVHSDNPAISMRPGPELLDRTDPVNPGYPNIVSYTESDPKPVRIGPYASINDNCYILLGSMHKTDCVSTWVFQDAGISESEQVTDKGAPVIGSDALVSFQSLILSGVTLGHGCVVAARAVVTKDVQPYEIVAGIPAKHVGWRFDEPTREALLRISWWEWPHAKVLRHARQLTSKDVQGFVARHDPTGEATECEDCLPRV
jgi:acetyltransferase-like isoleucine patch superfamily enzyme